VPFGEDFFFPNRASKLDMGLVFPCHREFRLLGTDFPPWPPPPAKDDGFPWADTFFEMPPNMLMASS
jgi:hypothetical protein